MSVYCRLAALMILTFGLLFAAAAEDQSDDPKDCAQETADIPVLLSPAEKIYGLSIIWRTAAEDFPFFDQVPDLDWDLAYQEALPKVLAADTCFAYIKELRRFIALLNDGHTNLYTPGLANHYLDYAPFALRRVENKVVIMGVWDIWEDQVPLGSELLSVDGKSVAEIMAERVLPYIAQSAPHIRLDWATNGNYPQGIGILIGEQGSTARLTYKTPQGEIRQFETLRDAWHGEPDGKSFRRAETGFAKRTFEFKWLEDQIAYANLPSFGSSDTADAFDEIAKQLRDARAVILDLRANGGGDTREAQRILAHFADKDLAGSHWRSRKHVSVYKVWGRSIDPADDAEGWINYAQGTVWEEGDHPPVPAAQAPIKVPVIILTSRNTASAAEDFLIYADQLDTATIIGEPSFGSTGQPTSLSLPGGLEGRMVTKRDSYPDGRDFVGFGVQPDIKITPTISGLLEGRDEILEAALKQIMER